MKIYLLFLLLFVLGHLSAQDIQIGSESDFKRFKSSTTYIVKYDDPFSEYNTYIEEDMKTVWTITPYKIISLEEFEKLKIDKESSFIFLSEAIKESQENIFKINILNIVLGSRSGNYNNMPDLGSAPLSYVFEDWDDEDTYVYKLAGILRFFQYYVNYNLTHPGSNIKDVIKANKSGLEEKELFLIKSDLASDCNTEAKISKYYDGKVRLVNKNEIREAIHKGNTDVVFLHKVGPNKNKGYPCMKFLINAGSGALLYFDKHKVTSDKPDAFLPSDFKSL